MTLVHIRRGIEFDTMKTIENLPKYEDNRSAYEIADCVAEHIEKFVYVCSDEATDEVITEIKALAKKATEVAQELANGEKYYVHQDNIASKIADKVQAISKRLLTESARPKF